MYMYCCIYKAVSERLARTKLLGAGVIQHGWTDAVAIGAAAATGALIDSLGKGNQTRARVCVLREKRESREGKEEDLRIPRRRKKKKKKRSDGGEEETQVGRGRKSVAREREQERERSRFNSVQPSPSKVKSLSFSLPLVAPRASLWRTNERNTPHGSPCPLLFTRKYSCARGRVLVQKKTDRQTDRQDRREKRVLSRSRPVRTCMRVCMCVCIVGARVLLADVFLPFLIEEETSSWNVLHRIRS